MKRQVFIGLFGNEITSTYHIVDTFAQRAPLYRFRSSCGLRL
jgi:hypothetical protein